MELIFFTSDSCLGTVYFCGAVIFNERFLKGFYFLPVG